MNSPLRRVGVVAMVLFVLLFANLTWVQFVQADKYRSDPLNRRVLISEYQRQRGVIQVDKEAVARSVPAEGELKFRREYPKKDVYAHVVGYKAVALGATGIEGAENKILSGDDDRLFVNRLTQLFTGRAPAGGNVLLTLSGAAQEQAVKELGKNKGAIVALDPKTGAIKAAASGPTYDPSPLANNDNNAAQKAGEALEKDPNKPLLNRAFQENFPPASTFKLLTSAVALENGLKPDSMVKAGASYSPPKSGQFSIRNVDTSVCSRPEARLEETLAVSCNTSFARLCAGEGNEAGFGAEKIKDMARRFGYEDKSLAVPMKVAGSFTGPMAQPDELAKSCIGQQDVKTTPMLGAMIAASIANKGVQMRPYLVQEIKGSDLATLETTTPKELRRPVSEETASNLRSMMKGVVENGTGRSARIDGYEVGGKTGTAENQPGQQDHGWFVGYAMKDGEPVLAIAVFLERIGQGGSETATKIAGNVMKAALEGRGK